jgi:hypothetical protein
MAKAPDDRWPTAADLGRALQAIERDAGRRADHSRSARREAAQPGRDGARGTGFGSRWRAATSAHSDIGQEDPQLGLGARHHPRSLRGQASRRRRRGRWLAAAVAVAGAVIGIGLRVVLTAGSPGAPDQSKPAAAANPSPALAAQLAPRQVEINNEQPTTVTLHWADPSNGRYPFVVKVSKGSVQTATSPTQTVVGGLDPTTGYRFVVGATNRCGRMAALSVTAGARP